MVDVAQSVRALDCGSRGRRFESGLPPKKPGNLYPGFFIAFLSDPNRSLKTISLAVGNHYERNSCHSTSFST